MPNPLAPIGPELPNLGIHQNPEILDQYMPWSKMIQAECSK